MKKNIDMFKNENIHNILRSTGYVRDPKDVNLLDLFYSEYNTTPFILDFDCYHYFYWDVLYNELKKKYPDLKILFQDKKISLKHNVTYFKQQTLELSNGFMLHLEGDLNKEQYLSKNDDIEDKQNVVTFTMFLSVDETNDNEITKLIEIFNKAKIIENEVVNIGMVSMEQGQYYVKDFNIMEKISDLELLDLHYGVGFEEFNAELLNRLLNKSKGLTLLHGDPGTGKTTFVRHLIKQIIKDNKDNNILYFPPTMVDFITEPAFINFVSDWVSDNKGKTYILIEDAEPLLESRNQSRNLGITNLLNLTDGILNDIFNIQIIATFNTQLQNLDKALLRPERLLARKEFKALPIEHALELARYLKIDESLIVDKMTLAELYSLKKETKPLTHDIVEIKKMGFGN